MGRSTTHSIFSKDNIRQTLGAAVVLTLIALCAPAEAGRPLLDKGQWDRYFALFARDVSVPWKPATVRLSTYSGAPLDFSAYNVDPADVIIAGQNRAPRPLDTARRKAVVRWRFSPPPGFRFESNDVAVPIGAQEGFYVIEARRGDAVQQVWINRTHIGLLTKESPDGLVVWAVDLRSGGAIANLSISFLVGLQLLERKTDFNGLVVWRDARNRPSFALAEQGAARAFVSLLPQAPLPGAIVGMRLESAVVRAGSNVRFAGFVRRRQNGVFKLAGGVVNVTLVGGGRTLASARSSLDASGAFDGSIAVPEQIDAGDYAVLASAAGAVGGTGVHVDSAGDVLLTIRDGCPCDPHKTISLAIAALRGRAPAPNIVVSVRVVRSPHIIPPSSSAEVARWGTTTVYYASLRTGADGIARAELPAPTDGLDSTYGVEATTSGASATARIAVPNAPVALEVMPAVAVVDPGQPAVFDVRGFKTSDGSASAGTAVRLRLSHGSTEQERDLTLDEHGYARAIFHNVSLGSNLAIAAAEVDGRQALDAAAVNVEPRALSGTTASDAGAVRISLDKARYRAGDRVTIRAVAPGSVGAALLTLEGARTYATRVASVVAGEATATLDLGDPQGDVRAAAAFVRDGAIAFASLAIRIDGPGRARLTELVLDRAAYAPGEKARATIRDGGETGPATYVMRIADGIESGAALFDDAAAILAGGGTTSQDPASENPTWHAYVAPASSKASDIFAAEEPRKVPSGAPSIGAAAPRTLLWRIERQSEAALDVEVPKERGRYVLSVLKISSNGSVGAASIGFEVR